MFFLMKILPYSILATVLSGIAATWVLITIVGVDAFEIYDIAVVPTCLVSLVTTGICLKSLIDMTSDWKRLATLWSIAIVMGVTVVDMMVPTERIVMHMMTNLSACLAVICVSLNELLFRRIKAVASKCCFCGITAVQLACDHFKLQ